MSTSGGEYLVLIKVFGLLEKAIQNYVLKEKHMLNITLTFAKTLIVTIVISLIGCFQPATAAVVNVALNKTAYQSSTHSVAEASRAVDGNIDGRWRLNSVSHTLLDPEPWLEVDLGESYEIEGIAIWNRTDCCKSRLSDYYIFIKNSPFDSNSLSDLLIEPHVTSFHQTSIPDPKSFIQINKVLGRYVRIQKLGQDALNLAELEVFADDKTYSGLANIALNKPAKLSSVFENADADRAVDGHSNGVWRRGSIGHSLADAEPWLEIDLQASYRIDSVNIWNRVDCCANRLSDYYVFIKDSPFIGEQISELSIEVGVSSFHQTSKPSPNASITTNDVVGRYVRLQKIAQGALNIAEVEVLSDAQPILPKPQLDQLYNRVLPDDVQLSEQGLPILHSQSSAKTQIYLGFDGHGERLPFDIDGDPNSFNYEEQTYIYNWWYSTAAHFSMFDVDVTTELDPSRPHSWNLISPSARGGVAFGRVGYKNAPITLVTPRFGPYSTIIGHEGGHTFGLPHVIGLADNGEMNRAYYYSPYALRGWHLGAGDLIVNKWSNKFHWNSVAQYYGEIEKIIEYLTGFDPSSSGYRVDDHSSAFSNASVLSKVEREVYSRTGVIETMDDRDMFYLDWPGGPAIVHSGSVELSPVNIDLALYDESKNLITTYRNGENHQFLSVNLAAGRYYLELSSASRYSDLGQYKVSVTPVSEGWQVANLGPKRSIEAITYEQAQKKWTLQSSGGDVWGHYDNAVFVHQPTFGDAEIVARIDNLSNTEGWAKTGVMFRANLTPESAHVSLLHSPVNGLGVFVRRADGQHTSYHFGIAKTDAKWVKLTRTQQAGDVDVFTAAISTDSINWQTIGEQTLSGIASNMHTGFIQAAKNRVVMMTSTVSHVAIANQGAVAVDASLNTPNKVNIVSRDHQQVVLNWDGVATADNYIIERSEDGFSFNQLAVTADNQYVDSEVLSAHTYHYRVRAQVQNSYSLASLPVSTELRAGAVLDLRVISHGENGILLDWGEPLAHLGYKIERSDNGSDFYSIADGHASFADNLANQSFANTQKYVDSGLQAGTVYHYRVTTVDKQGYSASSTATGSTRLKTPEQLTVVSTSADEIALQWQKVDNATEYLLQYLDDGQWKTLAVLDADITSYKHQGVEHSSLYQYRIQAKSDITSSAIVQQQVVTPAETPPTSPWQHQQINTQSGVVNQDDLTDFTFISKSHDVWHKVDSLQFVYQTIDGDFDAKVKVEQLDHTANWSKAGIMARTSIDNNVEHVSAFVTGNQGVAMQWRPSINSISYHQGQQGAELKAPYWLRLQRQGDEFTTLYSPDGTQWQTLHRETIGLQSSLQVGLAHTTNNRASGFGVAKFSQIVID